MIASCGSSCKRATCRTAKLVRAIPKNNFLIVDVLFNSILVEANNALAEIARILSLDDAPATKWAKQTSKGLQDNLWDAQLGTYRNYDMIKGGLTAADRSMSLTSFMPIYAAIPSKDQIEAMVALLDSQRFATSEEIATGKVRPLVTFDRTSPLFNSHNYWRGPVWINTNWLLIKGLRKYESDYAQAYADSLEQATFKLLLDVPGFWEYFDAFDSTGHGTDIFSWSAALYLDLFYNL